MRWQGKVKWVAVASAACGFLAGAATVGMNAFASTTPAATSPGVTAPAPGPQPPHPGRVNPLLAEQPALAAWLGLTPTQLRADLQSGTSLNQIAAAQGKQSGLLAELTALVNGELQGKVQSGKMSADRAAHIEKSLDSRLPALAANTHLEARPPMIGARMRVFDVAAADLHLTRGQLMAKLKSGESMAQIATAEGIGATAFTAQLESQVDAKVNQHVDALVNRSAWPAPHSTTH